MNTKSRKTQELDMIAAAEVKRMKLVQQVQPDSRDRPDNYISGGSKKVDAAGKQRVGEAWQLDTGYCKPLDELKMLLGHARERLFSGHEHENESAVEYWEGVITELEMRIQADPNPVWVQITFSEHEANRTRRHKLHNDLARHIKRLHIRLAQVKKEFKFIIKVNGREGRYFRHLRDQIEQIRIDITFLKRQMQRQT